MIWREALPRTSFRVGSKWDAHLCGRKAPRLSRINAFGAAAAARITAGSLTIMSLLPAGRNLSVPPRSEKLRQVRQERNPRSKDAALARRQRPIAPLVSFMRCIVVRYGCTAAAMSHISHYDIKRARGTPAYASALSNPQPIKQGGRSRGRVCLCGFRRPVAAEVSADQTQFWILRFGPASATSRPCEASNCRRLQLSESSRHSRSF